MNRPADDPGIRQRPRWAAAAVALVLLGTLLGVTSFIASAGRSQLAAAVAEADRLDPGWRWDDLMAGRGSLPDELNGALVVARAAALLSSHDPDFVSGVTNWGVKTHESFQREVTTEPHDFAASDSADSMSEILADIRACRPAVEAVRDLGRSAGGRYPAPLPNPPSLWSFGLDESDRPAAGVVRVASALQAVAWVAAEAGETDAALDLCRSQLAAARTLDRHPGLPAADARASCRFRAHEALVRGLGGPAASDAALAAVQLAFRHEAESDSGVWAARTHRALMHAFVTACREGRVPEPVVRDLTVGERWITPDPLVPPAVTGLAGVDASLNRPGPGALEHAQLLRGLNRVVEAAKAGPAARALRNADTAAPEPLARFPERALWSAAFYLQRELTSRADAATAAGAIACERFRLAEGRWPDRWDELVPRFSDAVPADPMTGRPLLLGRRPDGLVVYSVGLDGRDHGGRLIYKFPFGQDDTDRGTPLWDPDKRRPARPEVRP